MSFFELTESRLSTLAPVDLMMLSTSIVHAQLEPPPAWLNALVATLTAYQIIPGGGFPSQHLPRMGWAAARLLPSPPPPELAEWLVAGASHAWGRVTPEHATILFWALGHTCDSSSTRNDVRVMEQEEEGEGEQRSSGVTATGDATSSRACLLQWRGLRTGGGGEGKDIN
jgi:hypothetical protein